MSGTVVARQRRRPFVGLLRLTSFNIFALFVVLGVVFTLLSPSHRMVDPDNLSILFGLGAEFNMIALAVGLLMICGEFDLSVGSILVFCSFVLMELVNAGVNIALASVLTLATGCVIGLLNGFITVRAGIPSFITTLGTMMIWRGVTMFWSEGLQKPFDVSSYVVFGKIFSEPAGGVVPVQLVWFVGIAVVLWLVVHRMRLGNWVFITGDNRLAARAMGVNTDAVKMGCFALVGLVCALVAIMQISRTGAFSSRAGDGWEMKALAAAVIGGTSMTGGVGSMAGVFWGALTVSLIENALAVLRIPYFWSYTVFGVVIVASVVATAVFARRRGSVGRETG